MIHLGMKTIRHIKILACLTIPFLTYGQSSPMLMGEWQLITIEKYGFELDVADKEYYLEFLQSTIEFTIIPNECSQNYHVTGTKIITEGERGCQTNVVEDLPETVVNANHEIDYSGQFILREGVLTIENDNAIFRLKRKKD